MRPASHDLLARSAAILLTACGGAQGPAVVVRDSAGIRIVESLHPIWDAATTPTLSAAPVVQVGSVDGAPEYQLLRIGGAARLTSGNIVIADGGSQEIRWYNAEGRFVQKRGGEGDGPGEYRFLRTLLYLPGDSLVVEEPMKGELRLYTPTGDLVRSWPIPALGPFNRPPPFGRLPDGRFVATTERTLSPPPGHVHSEATLLRYGESGPADTVALLPGGETYLHPCGPNNSAICNVGVAYGIRLSATMHAGRIVAGNGETYELRVYDASGVLTAFYRRLTPAVPLTETRAAWYRDSVIEGVPASRRATALELQQASPLRSTMPAYFALVPDAKGRLWVARPDEETGTTRPWDVFDAEGGWLGTVAVPRGLRVLQIGAEFVLGIEKDEDGVEFVRVYALQE